MGEGRNFFEELVNIDVEKWTEKKNNLDYLEWATAWLLLKNKFPLSTFKPSKNENDRPWFTDPESKTGWVELTVMIPELQMEQTDTYPIMNLKMNSESSENIDSVKANKALRRCLAKIIAEMTGIGLDLYRKSDFTSDEKEVELAREKLAEIYKKKTKLSAEAKEQADKVKEDTNKEIELAINAQEKLDIYMKARKTMLLIRK